MSAQKGGRQSPDPENQEGKQQADPQAKPNQQDAAPSEEHAEKASDEAKNSLPSNPEHPLEKFAEQKTGKTMDPEDRQ